MARKESSAKKLRARREALQRACKASPTEAACLGQDCVRPGWGWTELPPFARDNTQPDHESRSEKPAEEKLKHLSDHVFALSKPPVPSAVAPSALPASPAAARPTSDAAFARAAPGDLARGGYASSWTYSRSEGREGDGAGADVPLSRLSRDSSAVRRAGCQLRVAVDVERVLAAGRGKEYGERVGSGVLPGAADLHLLESWRNMTEVRAAGCRGGRDREVGMGEGGREGGRQAGRHGMCRLVANSTPANSQPLYPQSPDQRRYT